MSKVRITFEVDKDRAETIVGLLIKDVANFHVEEVVRANGRSPTTLSDADRIKWAGPYAKAIIDHMKTKPAGTEFFYKDLSPIIEKAGMKGSSISSILSIMAKMKKLRRTKRGYYSLL